MWMDPELAECSAPPIFSGSAVSSHMAPPISSTQSELLPQTREMAGSLVLLITLASLFLVDPAASAPQSLTNSYLPPPPVVVEPKCRLETRKVEEEVEEEVCTTIQVQVKYLHV